MRSLSWSTIHPFAAALAARWILGTLATSTRAGKPEDDSGARTLGAHGEGAGAGRAQRLGEAGKLAQELACVARVDDLLDPERLGGAEGRAQRIEPRLDLRQPGLRVGGGVDLGAVGGLDAALQR